MTDIDARTFSKFGNNDEQLFGGAERWMDNTMGMGNIMDNPMLTGAQTSPYGGMSFFGGMFDNAWGKEGWFNPLAGTILGGLSAYDQYKTNKLNRKATKYALDRKRKEDLDYDKFRAGWGTAFGSDGVGAQPGPTLAAAGPGPRVPASAFGG